MPNSIWHLEMEGQIHWRKAFGLMEVAWKCTIRHILMEREGRLSLQQGNLPFVHLWQGATWRRELCETLAHPAPASNLQVVLNLPVSVSVWSYDGIHKSYLWSASGVPIALSLSPPPSLPPSSSPSSSLPPHTHIEPHFGHLVTGSY